MCIVPYSDASDLAFFYHLPGHTSSRAVQPGAFLLPGSVELGLDVIALAPCADAKQIVYVLGLAEPPVTVRIEADPVPEPVIDLEDADLEDPSLPDDGDVAQGQT